MIRMTADFRDYDILLQNVILRSEAVALAHELLGRKTYGDYSYLYHLSMVESALLAAGVQIADKIGGQLLIAAWLHDTIEDAGISYRDVARQFGEDVAEIVRSVTNDIRGRNRHERHLSVVPELLKNPLGRILKLADRLANTTAANDRMRALYIKEYPQFRTELFGTGNNNEGDYLAIETRLWSGLDTLHRAEDN